MYEYIILCVFVCSSGVICDLNIPEGGECEWDGAKGVCVQETRCLTTLDDKSEKAPICSKKDEETYICCTDCELVNDTRNAMITPSGSLFWKDGRKARDNCLQYLVDLPYLCRGSYYGGLKREPVAEGAKCHSFSLWAVGGPPSLGDEEPAQYPNQALLGFGKDLETAKWLAGGAIISDRFILTAAYPTNFNTNSSRLSFVAVNVKNLRDPPSSWQTHKIKRVVTHPEYKPSEFYNDIALIETETTIIFSKDVKPSCIHIDEDIFTDRADSAATSWKGLRVNSHQEANSINAGLLAEPMQINGQLSHCISTVIGITSFGQTGSSETYANIPDIYTRVAPFIPWIESIVWP